MTHIQYGPLAGGPSNGVMAFQLSFTEETQALSAIGSILMYKNQGGLVTEIWDDRSSNKGNEDLLTLVKALKDNGHVVSLICSGDRWSPAYGFVNNLTVWYSGGPWGQFACNDFVLCMDNMQDTQKVKFPPNDSRLFLKPTPGEPELFKQVIEYIAGSSIKWNIWLEGPKYYEEVG